jgi:outer membrane protein insertion porin family
LIQGAQNFCALNICVKDDLAMRVTAGLSVNWRSPFGPVEINIGHPIVMQSYDKPATVQFTAGTMF